MKRILKFIPKLAIGKRKCRWCSKEILVFVNRKDEHVCIDCEKLLAIVKSKVLIIQEMLIYATRNWEGRCRICEDALPIFYEEVCKKCRDNYDHLV